MSTCDLLSDGKFFDWQFSICTTYFEVRNAYLLNTTQIMELENATSDEKMDLLSVIDAIYSDYEKKFKDIPAN
ncbi:hypothetical protein [Ammoniphilus sp. 3BR4]|uniref:hypothetical protein n=1 Tax=Ammoniphilus sp. 3BR4 TaxID=3158265 RepID=UPI0034675203